ncbi:DUF3789 domain-containing protein [Porcipelethomonas ammoniilytica]|uniref:DUF3789 domain-containing protein n=1 Tax=Porcipelethomonas ammoniilytica TaxID=2981722 RepID=UPI0008221C27|nr:DUF3789 domain-containing protein [Porcipelethomonas ammoniilytica]MCU6720511.1 DUF3789 domain-containing protein [Porcipelethomonas ammoniilytica]SCJ16075.1 Uncharacterised protein [uncultured Ruminococcus sp.]
MVYLFIGMVIGGTAGLFTGCLLTTAKEADKEIKLFIYFLSAFADRRKVYTIKKAALPAADFILQSAKHG